MEKLARVVALYLPQFHPVPENDEWWGNGFTEWTNTARAKPMFRGHYQPHVPADLGFYDLRMPETRAAQAEMAKKYGIEAFCYYHYWFGGRRLLERPFNEVMESGEPDFPFCLCWANQTWTGIWHGCPDRILIEQTYPGEQDHKAHFDFLLRAFTDRRYMTIDGKPVFIFLKPWDIPDINRLTDLWRQMALKNGLKGLYFIGTQHPDDGNCDDHGLDAFVLPQPVVWDMISKKNLKNRAARKFRKLTGKPLIFRYDKVFLRMLENKELRNAESYPCLIPNWDNTPRSGKNGVVLHGSTPELFRMQVKEALKKIGHMSGDHRIIFVKSWNEWAEGNHLEPDMKYGLSYLEVIKEEVEKY